MNYDCQYIGQLQYADTALARTTCGCKVGSVRVADLNGDGKLKSDDRTIIGRHYNFPRWQGSMNNRFTFKNADLSALTTARIGFTINDAFTAAYDGLAGRFNNIATNYWTLYGAPGHPPKQAPTASARSRALATTRTAHSFGFGTSRSATRSRRP